LFWTLLDILPDFAFSLNGNVSDASDSMQYHSSLAGSLVFRDLANFSSRNISAYDDVSSLSFWLAIGPYIKIIFIQFHGTLFDRMICVDISHAVQFSRPEISFIQ
jgi:hypothetical protein